MVKPSIDPRFAKAFKDPRFKRISKKERKVKIDSRFQKMFTDERFHTKFSVDKRGRRIDRTEKEDLHKFYDLENDDVAEIKEDGKHKVKEGSEKANQKKKMSKRKKTVENQDEPDNEIQESTKTNEKESDLKEDDKEVKETTRESDDEDDSSEGEPDFSDIRGQNIESDGEESSNEDNDTEIRVEVDENGIVHGWGELDEDAKRIENAETHRLAVCNCDWDRITASDLYVLFNSFKPVTGTIRSVKIYMSNFGRERLKEEDMSGPKELKESALDSDEESGNEGNVEGSRYHMEKLREYQMNRMKYYYAVVECNDKETADKLYEECDGMEYEMSGTRLDLRFIPEDMTFDSEPTAVADEKLNLKTYEPTTFLNTALQQSTVRLTWDEPDPKRMQKTMRKFTVEDLETMDFKDYIASSSSEDEEDIRKRQELKKKTKREEQKHKDTKTNDENTNIEKLEHQDDSDHEIEPDMDEAEQSGDEDVNNVSSEGDVSSDDDMEERIKKYRLLMEEINAKEKKDETDEEEDEGKDDDGEMEFEWSMSDAKENSNTLKRTSGLLRKSDMNDEGSLKQGKKDDNLIKKDSAVQKGQGKKGKYDSSIQRNQNKNTGNRKENNTDSENGEDLYNDDDVDYDEDLHIDGDENCKENNEDEGFDDPFFQQPGDTEKTNKEKKVKKKKKKRLMKEEEMTEEQKRNKDELELLMVDESEERKHFSLKGILEHEKMNKKSSKRKRRKNREEAKESRENSDDFQFNVKDERFNALYDSHLFSIDPSEPNFKKTKATEAIIKEAQKRREVRAHLKEESVKSTLGNESKKRSEEKNDVNLSLLVNSVKSKTLKHQEKKKKSKLK